MKIILLVALGGAIGSVARYLVGKLSLLLWGPDFPWGTLIVNILGCFVMGVLAGLLAHYTQLSQEVRMFLLVGILGGFTTFSAFSLDLVTLYQRGALMVAGLYLFASIVASVAALLGGMALVRNFIS
ncbi:MAG: fluoride efflux transporter CrcB [Micavibrio aeruginosavorus]|uniref:Fluoride-specific ion channel FluC n=1 Tax=Micavibrio aeruginosavorus TaxID=349221 RepID=A0A2W5HFP8_9BACT|nr:MAG: fluoride efflux transporter CrcB [Micavibrio aeruginosavorus]